MPKTSQKYETVLWRGAMSSHGGTCLQEESQGRIESARKRHVWVRPQQKEMSVRKLGVGLFGHSSCYSRHSLLTLKGIIYWKEIWEVSLILVSPSNVPLIPTQIKKKYLTNSEPQLWNIQSQGLKLQCTRLSEGLGTNHAAQQIQTWQRRAAAVKEPSALLKVIS